ncbi:hypothetical protein ACLOJK_036976, partial [Asimina triloba]
FDRFWRQDPVGHSVNDAVEQVLTDLGNRTLLASLSECTAGAPSSGAPSSPIEHVHLPVSGDLFHPRSTASSSLHDATASRPASASTTIGDDLNRRRRPQQRGWQHPSAFTPTAIPPWPAPRRPRSINSVDRPSRSISPDAVFHHQQRRLPSAGKPSRRTAGRRPSHRPSASSSTAPSDPAPASCSLLHHAHLPICFQPSPFPRTSHPTPRRTILLPSPRPAARPRGNARSSSPPQPTPAASSKDSASLLLRQSSPPRQQPHLKIKKSGQAPMLHHAHDHHVGKPTIGAPM